MWDLAADRSGEGQAILRCPHAATAVELSPDGTAFTTVGSDGLLRLRKAPTNGERQSIRIGSTPGDIR